MEDLVQQFEWKGEVRSLYFGYRALFAIEKETGLALTPMYRKVEDASIVALTSCVLHGLEAHRREVDARLPDRLRWTVEDAQAIVMDLGPLVVAKIVAEGIARTCLKGDPEPGKQLAGPVPTGPASS